MKTDVVVIGGGAIGASVAYHLRSHQKRCEVTVVEPDPAYGLASTPRASGGVRSLFSLPENILLSQYSIGIFAEFPEAMGDKRLDIGFKRNGYVFVVPPEAKAMLGANFEIQQRLGVNVVWLEPSALQDKFPSMNVKDLGAAVHSPDDGWLDPHSVLQAYRTRSKVLGACYLTDEVIGLEREGPRIRKAKLRSGQEIEADAFVNAAGAWAKNICAMVDAEIPIEPMRRYEHYFEAEEEIEPLPYFKDVGRLAFRPEGRGYSGGLVDMNEPRGFNFDIDHNYFEDVVWPALAHRFRAFERTKVKNTLPGLYDQNEFDGNLIIGPGVGGLANFHMLAGLSGHGLMHVPGCGRAMAELLLDGRYETIDLRRFGWQRILDNAPLPERGII